MGRSLVLVVVAHSASRGPAGMKNRSPGRVACLSARADGCAKSGAGLPCVLNPLGARLRRAVTIPAVQPWSRCAAASGLPSRPRRRPQHASHVPAMKTLRQAVLRPPAFGREVADDVGGGAVQTRSRRRAAHFAFKVRARRGETWAWARVSLLALVRGRGLPPAAS